MSVLVLVRTWIDQGASRRTLQIDDVEREEFTALARTTAYPATALAHLVTTGKVMRPGVHPMNEVVRASEQLPELASVGITVTASSSG